MKIKILPLALAAILTISLTNCKKKAGPLACASETVKYSETISAWAVDQNQGNCEAVKDAILSLYSSCAVAAVDRAEYEDFENEFDCSNL